MLSARRGQIRILLILILPIIPRHTKLLQKHRLSNIRRPPTTINQKRRRKLLRGLQIRLTRIIHIIDAPVLHPAVRRRVVDGREVVHLLEVVLALLGLEADADELLGRQAADVGGRAVDPGEELVRGVGRQVEVVGVGA